LESASRLESNSTSIATIAPSAPAAGPFLAGAPFPASAEPSSAYSVTTTQTDGALAKAPEAAPNPTSAPTLESLRRAIGSALVDAGHVSAAQLLGSGTWTLEATSLRIQVPAMGKKMLALTINAAAEKIIRQELQRLGAAARFLVVPGDGAQSDARPTEAPPLAGSVHEAALANPLVQRAKEIFKAEVRSVVDLRQK
jgi:DNA polymerase III subunit gamma/tau